MYIYIYINIIVIHVLMNRVSMAVGLGGRLWRVFYPCPNSGVNPAILWPLKKDDGLPIEET
jgi:hypothetical protein